MFDLRLPEHISGMLNKVAAEDQPQGEEEAKFWRSATYELAEMLKAASKLERAEVVLNDFRKAGSQYIWEFYVNNLCRPKGNDINWHMQNISQWDYAGCILLQDGRVSLHH